MWYRFIRKLLFAPVLLLLNACISIDHSQPPPLVLQEHVLAGKIWHTRAGKFITEDEFNRLISRSNYLLLGELHDNIRHHQLQARIIDTLKRQGRDVSVSFEMIDDEQAKLLKRHSVTTTDSLIALLNQQQTNWRYSTQYRVVFDSVLHAGYEIRSANISRDRLRKMMKQGKDALPEELRQTLDKVSLDKKHEKDLQQQIVKSHCDMIPIAATSPMVLAQRARDAVMSKSLLQSKHNTKVLIAGAGHTRKDRGVPLYLQQLEKNSRITSLAFMEVDKEASDITYYQELWQQQRLPFDFIWFTPAVERQDPCLHFKKGMKSRN